MLKRSSGTQGRRVAVTAALDLLPVLYEIIAESDLALRESHVQDFAHVQFNSFCRYAKIARIPLSEAYIKVSTIRKNMINHCFHAAQNQDDEPSKSRYAYT